MAASLARTLCTVVAVTASLAVVASGADASGPVASCSLASARATIRVKKPTFAPFGQHQRVDAKLVDSVLCSDFTGDGRVDSAVTIASGGSAGDVGWIVIVNATTGPQIRLVHSAYKLSLARIGTTLVQTTPVYAKNDPNCCPSKGFDHTQWRWIGTRFAPSRSWHDRHVTVDGGVYGRRP